MIVAQLSKTIKPAFPGPKVMVPYFENSYNAHKILVAILLATGVETNDDRHISPY